ncbi:hypothetical protein Tco_0426249 [Tanacetum coccineum]
MKFKESLNVTFDESPPPTKLSPLVDDDVGEEEAIKKNTKIVNTNNEEDESIEVDKIFNINESKNHSLDQLKYVTQVRLAKRLTMDSFDDLFDYLQQFEKLANASRAKKLEKSHDPLALVAPTSSSFKNTSSYYVTHPTSVVEYDDEYQQDDV